jgi:uncharacterized protein YdeI (YjbR/CyaY-like superfamily)
MVNKAMRAGAGVGAGDTATLAIELDQAPRTVTVPEDFQQALAKAREARTFLESLLPSHKRAYLGWILEAKKAETRARRIGKAVEMLTARQKRM